MISNRFTNGLYFLISGDSNCLNLDPIVNLSSQLKQIVDKPTRGNAILEPVITDLHSFYQKPLIEAPLQSDTENGEESDHKIVLVKPLNNIENKVENKVMFEKVRRTKHVTIFLHSLKYMYKNDQNRKFTSKMQSDYILGIEED